MRAAKFIFFMIILLTLVCSEATGSQTKGIMKDDDMRPSPILYPSSEGSSTGGGNFATQEGYPIIKRDGNPIFKDFYVNGKSYGIEVEIQGCARSFNDVMIKERIDPDLETDFSTLNISISDPFKTEKKYIKKSSLVTSNENIDYFP